jgi:putative oxidoreductase
MLKDTMGEISVLFSYPKNLIILVIRMILAYGFTKPALLKLNDISSTSKWFTSIDIPLSTLLAYIVTGIETVGIILLVLGLFTRFISLLLACVMLGAIVFVHASNGFSVVNNGIEIPLYYMIFLSILATFGGGKYSLDNLLFKDIGNG